MTDPYTPSFLDQQAQDTRPLREYLYQQHQIGTRRVLLDIGCGCGQIIYELIRATGNLGVGVDRDASLISKASRISHPRLQYILGDAHHLPLKSSSIWFAQFHFVLMWTSQPAQALAESKRVLRRLGVIMAVESDYSGRIESFPPYHSSIPKSSLPIVKTLQRDGADPFIGHRLPVLFRQLKLRDIAFGVLSWTYDSTATKQSLHADLNYSGQTQENLPNLQFAFTPVFWISATK